MFFRKKKEEQKQAIFENGKFIVRRFVLAWENNFFPSINKYEDFSLNERNDYKQGNYRFSFSYGENATLSFEIYNEYCYTTIYFRFDAEYETFTMNGYQEGVNGFSFRNLKEREVDELYHALEIEPLLNEIWDVVLKNKIDIHLQYNDIEQANTYKKKLKIKQKVGER